MKNKILIIDDDEANLSILNNRLKDIYDVKIAYNGLIALKVLDKHPDIDLMLIDIEMPLMNGYELANKLQSNEQTKNIPFIFLTANQDDGSIIKGFELGASDFISKPFRQNELEIRIKNHLSNYLYKKQIEKDRNEILSREKIINEYLIYSETDLNGIITKVSKSFCELSEYTQDELIGNSHSLVRHPDMPKELFEDLWKTIKNNKTWNGEIKNKTKNGHYYWVQATVSQKYDLNGNHVGYISLRQEITAKKNHEEQEKKIAEDNKLSSLKELIGNISHHWRQPLSVITTVSSGIKIENEFGILDTSELNEKLDEILNSSFYLSKIIEEFSSYINADNNFMKISLKEQLETSLILMNSILSNNSVKTVCNFRQKDDVEIYTVKKELTQILINILTNAKDALEKNHTPDKIITIDFEVEDNNIIISIEDNGCGIAPENLNSIFEPYFTTKHKSKGKGLSLYTSLNIIKELLNGDLYVKNSSNGVIFYIKIPIN